MPIELKLATKLPDGVDSKQFDAAIKELQVKLGPSLPDGVINLKLVDDSEIKALNKNYSGQDSATDVLSFSYIEDGTAPVEGELGDIAISLETAARQAEQANTDLETELVLLTIHGCLHVLGYDHATEDSVRELDHLQDGIMTAIGLTYRNFQWDSSKA